MKKSELKQIIKEEIKNILNEDKYKDTGTVNLRDAVIKLGYNPAKMTAREGNSNSVILHFAQDGYALSFKRKNNKDTWKFIGKI